MSCNDTCYTNGTCYTNDTCADEFALYVKPYLPLVDRWLCMYANDSRRHYRSCALRYLRLLFSYNLELISAVTDGSGFSSDFLPDSLTASDRQYYFAVKSFVSYVWNEYSIEDHASFPKKNVARSLLPKQNVLSPAQIDTILQASLSVSDMGFLLVSLASSTALNLDSLQHIKCENLFCISDRFYLLVASSTRSVERAIEISSEMGKIISYYIKKHQLGNSDYLFKISQKKVQEKSVPASKRTLSLLAQKIAVRSGIGFELRDLRTACLANSVRTHQDAADTFTYASVSPRYLRSLKLVHDGLSVPVDTKSELYVTVDAVTDKENRENREAP